jgi:hypothetical protein
MPTKFIAALLFATPILLSAGSTSTTLASSTNPSVLGHAVTLTASVTPPTATGAVTFYSGTTILETVPLANGTATYATVLLPSGVQSLKAYYGGDANDAPSASAILTQTVNTVAGNGFQEDTLDALAYTVALAVADFNHDGKVDIAGTGGPSGPYLVVELGNGDGTFKYSSEDLGPCFAVAVGDFNGDGNADLVVTSGYGGTTFNVLLGNGDGTFQTPLTYSTNGTTVSVADVNGDGKADLVFLETSSTEGSGSVDVLLGNGDGTFQPAIIYNTSKPTSFAIGDFNGNGIPDLIIASSWSGTVSIALGNGDGTFNGSSIYTYPSGEEPEGIAVADFNGDGKEDFAVAVPTSSGLASVFLGNGNGTFQAPLNSNANYYAPTALAVADFNGDGKPDLALSNPAPYPGAGVNVLLGNGDGTFQAAETAESVLPAIPVVSDFNGDGVADFAVTDGDGNFASVFLGKPAAVAMTSTSLTSSPNPSTFDQTVTLTASVTPSTATGGVTFYHGSTALGTGTLSSGTAAFTTSTLATGGHTLTATYGGDANDQPSTSAPVTQVVEKAPTSTTLSSSPNPSTFPQSVVLAAKISPSSATGTVTFYAGGKNLGNSSVDEGTAMLTVSSLPVGPHTVTADYSGDANHSASDSSPITQIVRDPTATILTASPNPSKLNQTVTLTATVTPSTATGTVTFYHGSTAMGSATLSNGAATLKTSSLPSGSHSLTAAYAGNTLDAPSTSPIVDQMVN